MSVKSSASAEETAHEDMRWAIEHTTNCASDRSCLSRGKCLDQDVCRALSPVGRSAGFVVPTPSAARCGYCIPSFNGFLCFCPTRWALHRTAASPA